MTEPIWRDIRRLRADPPGLAETNKARRRTFGAALQQAEELHGASAASGYSSRPLPLFYALSQGGRAIAAARASNRLWELSGHGLEAKFDSDTVLEARVSPGSSGAFQVVAEATGSAGIVSDLALGALLASLPEFSMAATLGSHPLAIGLELEDDETFGEHFMLLPPYGQVAVYIGPEASLPPGERQEQAMAELLPAHGRARGWGIHPGIRHARGMPCIALAWPIQTTTGERKYKALDVVATRMGDRYFLRPTLGEDEGEISMLMTWWAVLLLLSSLARYEPARWQRALDVDGSAVAATLEEALDLAQERVPELLYEALTEDTALAALVHGL